MYYLTGLPGWMRFGYSPGWVGRSPGGLPPIFWLGQPGYAPPVTPPVTPPPTAAPYPATLPKDAEIRMLKQQRDYLKSLLENIENRIKELEGK